MKKILLTVVVAFLSIGFAYAYDDVPITVEQLPQKAQQFLKSYFPQVGVSFAKKESDIIGNEYDVVLTDGSKMEFTSKGEWKSVECKGGAVPADIVPKQITQYVAKNYPDTKILKIDRDYREYEVYLSNRLELTFNKDFKLVDIDD